MAAAALAAWPVPARAQYPGRVSEDQQGGVHLRATAVLEYTGQLGKIKESRLVPIAVWDGMQYQPGGLYLAQPAPLAVESGTEYELESAGRLKGVFDVRDAEDLSGMWIGVGKYQPPPPPKPRLPPSQSNHTYVVRDYGQDDPDKPHFAHVPADDQQQNGAQKASAADAGPALHSRTGGAGGAGTAAANQPAIDPDRPTFSRRSDSPAGSSAGVAIDPNRPRLSYAAPEEQEKLAKPDALFGLPAGMQQVAGISDTRPPERESWDFSWANPDDEAKMKAAVEQMAEEALAPPAPAAAPAPGGLKGSRHKAHKPAPAPLPMLTDEEFHAYSLSFGGGATLVFTARTSGTPAKYVTIIAQPDFYGKAQLLLKQVTNADELDVMPRMRLIDAVDTVGNGRADLLFELRGQTFRQFAIYRVYNGTATQVFVTQPASIGPAGG